MVLILQMMAYHTVEPPKMTTGNFFNHDKRPMGEERRILVATVMFRHTKMPLHEVRTDRQNKVAYHFHATELVSVAHHGFRVKNGNMSDKKVVTNKVHIHLLVEK